MNRLAEHPMLLRELDAGISPTLGIQVSALFGYKQKVQTWLGSLV